MSYMITAGKTSQLIDIFIQDSSVTTGAGLSGLVYNSSGLACYYKRQGSSSWTSVSLATMTQGTWATGGFVEGDATHAKGVYEFGIPDAAIAAAAGVYWVDLSFYGATNMAPVVMRIILTTFDIQLAEQAVNITQVDGAALTSHASGKLPSDVLTWLGGVIPAVNVTGVPKVDIVDWLGAAPSALSSGLVQALSTLTAGERTTLIAALLNTVNTGATFNVANSVGKQIRQAAGNVPVSIRTGTCQTGSTANTIKLDSGASSTNDIYVGCIVFLTGGTGLGQTRTIVAYNGTTKVATVDTNWVTTPTNTSTFEIDASANSLVANEGTCQGGGASTITLASTASATNSLYDGSFVTILSGTGAGQTRVITGYVGSTKVATVDTAWSVQPIGADSTYAVIPAGNVAPPNTFTAPSAAEIVSTLLATVVASRDLTAVTEPTVEDALAGAVAVAAGDEAFTGLTLTLKFLDGSTLRTFTVDSATAPTSRT